jgi:serine/threonine protein kinase
MQQPEDPRRPAAQPVRLVHSSLHANVYVGDVFVLKQYLAMPTRLHFSIRELVVGRYLNEIGYPFSPQGYDGLRHPTGLVMRTVAGGCTLLDLNDDLALQMSSNGGSFCLALRNSLVALMELHRLGIVHGDVKPDNVMLVGFSSAALIDLGTAHLAPLTPHAAYMDTRILTAPAAFTDPSIIGLGGLVSTQNDVYALGVSFVWVLYRVAFGPLMAIELMKRMHSPPGTEACAHFVKDWVLRDASATATFERALEHAKRSGPTPTPSRPRKMVADADDQRLFAPSEAAGCEYQDARVSGSVSEVGGSGLAMYDFPSWCETAPTKPRFLTLIDDALGQLSRYWSARIRHAIRETLLRMLHPVWKFRPSARGVLQDLDCLVRNAFVDRPGGVEDCAPREPCRPLSPLTPPVAALIHEVKVVWRAKGARALSMALALHARWGYASKAGLFEQAPAIAALACLMTDTPVPEGMYVKPKLEALVRQAIHAQSPSEVLVPAFREVTEIAMDGGDVALWGYMDAWGARDVLHALLQRGAQRECSS